MAQGRCADEASTGIDSMRFPHEPGTRPSQLACNGEFPDRRASPALGDVPVFGLMLCSRRSCVATFRSGERIAPSDRGIEQLVPGQELFGIEGCHAAHPGAGHSLPVDVVGQVARRENTGDRRPGRSRFHHHIATIAERQLVLDQF